MPLDHDSSPIQINVRSANAKTSIKDKHPSTIVVFVRKGKSKTEVLGDPSLNKQLGELTESLLQNGLKLDDLKKSGAVLRLANVGSYKNVVIFSLDEKSKSSEASRSLGASVYACLKSNKIDSADIAFGPIAAHAQAFVEGVLLAAYDFKQFKTKKNDAEKDAPTCVSRLDLVVEKKFSPATLEKAISTAHELCDCVNFARDLGNVPGNLMTPELLADATIKKAKGTGLKVTVWDRARIVKEKFGGLLGVSLGSAVDPRFIIMEYNGAAKSKKPVCFVGKGLTFDSGGISIKPSAAMEEMKFDKCGGTAVIGTMLAIAKLKLKINAIGLVPATENMPGPLANKPGDILTARNGKTVEVDNTDAEGRLILMDALSYASELKPAVIFDAATLTGACVVALGNIHTGIFTRDKKLRKKIADAAEISGELVWALPIHDHHVSDMKGTYADLCNISSVKGAGASTAAAFLEQFVDKDIPWAHFDIAGTAWHVGNRLNYCTKKGASGVMVRTFVELAKIFG